MQHLARASESFRQSPFPLERPVHEIVSYQLLPILLTYPGCKLHIKSRNIELIYLNMIATQTASKARGRNSCEQKNAKMIPACLSSATQQHDLIVLVLWLRISR